MKYKSVIKLGSTLGLLIISAMMIVLLMVPALRSQVQEFVGLAVAQTDLEWNKLKDAAAGDNVTIGVGVFNPYLFDGTDFDRARGDTTNGMWVNVKATVTPTLSTTITTGQVTVDSTAGGTVIKAANSSRKSIIIRNQGAADMYIGPSGVSAANGLLVKTNESVTLDKTTAAIYGLCATSTTAGYLEE